MHGYSIGGEYRGSLLVASILSAPHAGSMRGYAIWAVLALLWAPSRAAYPREGPAGPPQLPPRPRPRPSSWAAGPLRSPGAGPGRSAPARVDAAVPDPRRWPMAWLSTAGTACSPAAYQRAISLLNARRAAPSGAPGRLFPAPHLLFAAPPSAAVPSGQTPGRAWARPVVVHADVPVEARARPYPQRRPQHPIPRQSHAKPRDLRDQEPKAEELKQPESRCRKVVHLRTEAVLAQRAPACQAPDAAAPDAPLAGAGPECNCSRLLAMLRDADPGRLLV